MWVPCKITKQRPQNKLEIKHKVSASKLGFHKNERESLNKNNQTSKIKFHGTQNTQQKWHENGRIDIL